MEKKISLNCIPKKAILITLYELRWFFFLIFWFIAVCNIILYSIGYGSYTQMAFIYSITGFFTFFISYLGWILAQDVIDKLSKNEDVLLDGLPICISEVNK